MDNNSKIPKNNPFKVPENYFEDFNSRILKTASGTSRTRSVVTRRITYYLAAAASVAVLVLAGYFGVKSFRYTGTDLNLAEQVISVDELIFSEVDILSIEDSTSVSGIIDELPEMENNEIIDYLVREDIDIALIYEQL